MVEGGIFSYNDENYKIISLIPVLDITKSIIGGSDPNVLIEKIAEIMFNYQLTTNQINNLKDILIPGLPDYEWTVEYSSYLSNPSDQDLSKSVENKL